MFEAGETLTEVVSGMRQMRWRPPMDKMWPLVMPSAGENDPERYFPVYDGVPHDPKEEHPLMNPVMEFVEPCT